MSSDPAAVLARALETATNIKFGRGVVGKTGHITLGLIVLWVVICLRIGENWIVDALLVGAGLIGTALGAWWISKIESFAERNPALALLEGAELVEYHRLDVLAKGGVVQVGDGSPKLLDKHGEGA